VWLVIGAAAASVSACSKIFGDIVFEGTGAAGTGGATSSSSAGSTSSTGTGGDAGGCDASTDLQADQHNCGRCGHDCMHGMCKAGTCQAWTVASSVTAVGMDADGMYVAWADLAQHVHQVKTDGSDMVTVSQSSVGFGPGPALRKGTLAFLGPGNVYGVPEGTAMPTAQAAVTGNYAAAYVALHPGGSIAFLLGVMPNGGATYSTYLLQCPLIAQGFCQPPGGGSQIDPGMMGVNLAHNLVVNATYAFWIYENGSPSIGRYTFGTDAVAHVSFNAISWYALAIDAVNVYWPGSSPSTIYWLPQSFAANAGPNKLVSPADAVTGLASDGTNVYFGVQRVGGSATLSYVPVSGGSTVVLFTSPNAMATGEEQFVVAVGGAVYWADTDESLSPPMADIMGIAAP
jgi:hypothetical protein